MINPFMPITINADLDVYDKTYVRENYSGVDQWGAKRSFLRDLNNLVLYVVCGSVLELPRR